MQPDGQASPRTTGTRSREPNLFTGFGPRETAHARPSRRKRGDLAATEFEQLQVAAIVAANGVLHECDRLAIARYAEAAQQTGCLVAYFPDWKLQLRHAAVESDHGQFLAVRNPVRTNHALGNRERRASVQGHACLNW